MLRRRNSFNVINKGESFSSSKEIVGYGVSDGWVAPLKRVVSAPVSENLFLISTLAGSPGDDSPSKKIFLALGAGKKRMSGTFSYDRSGNQTV